MTNALRKRDCDVKIKLTPSGTQYLHFMIDVKGEVFEFLPSSVMGEQFGAVISAVYTLFTEGYDGHSEWHDREYLSDENHLIHTIVTKVAWDSEGDNIDIIFSRRLIETYNENDFTEIEIKSYESPIKKFTVNTKDLCYAIAKACTEVLKQYGFYGYRYSTEYDTFNLHQLLYIKAFALSNFDARKLSPIDESDWAMCTSFEKEIELLLFDM